MRVLLALTLVTAAVLGYHRHRFPAPAPTVTDPGSELYLPPPGPASPVVH